MVEHVLAALYGVGIDDAAITVDGPELPILDGSALPYVNELRNVGLRHSKLPLESIRVTEPIEVQDGDKFARLEPYPTLMIDCTIEYTQNTIGSQRICLEVNQDTFITELAPARTFATTDEVKLLQANGLGLGGSLENTIIASDQDILNPGGLRVDREFARHKAMDVVGDLALAGAPILGKYIGFKSGHQLTNKLLRALMASTQSWSRCLSPARLELEEIK
jgi:UDP-3-O-[3-hydroxymyristoyl] N-acetylglucosamine deacetylase